MARKSKSKSPKESTPLLSRAKFMKVTIDAIIKTVNEFENPEEEFPRERLLEKLHILRGFIEDLRFPEDDELEKKTKSLARPNAGRPKPKTKFKIPSTPKQESYCRFINTGKPKNYNTYVAWANETENESVMLDERYFNKLNSQKFNCSSSK